MQTLYFDCFAGASGNMILGALISAGVDPDRLKNELAKLNLPELEINIEKVDRSGISAIHVRVTVADEKKHRHLPEIERIITTSGLSAGVKDRSISIFRRLAQAEASVHGIEVEKVHFHEVGALDAIGDIVGACVCFEILGIEQFACSKIHVGSGFVGIAHGKFPVPPPAVTRLLEGAPIYSTEIAGELITPTGAAIITTVCNNYGAIPELKLEATGYGAGTREYKDFPNVLRAMIGRAEAFRKVDHSENVAVLETNIDDLSPQVLGHLMEITLNAGALDCWFTPIQMKKNRPATKVSILCQTVEEGKFLEILYRETSTIGVRVQRMTRHSLRRETIDVETEFGKVGFKTAYLNGEAVNSQPEFDDLRAAAAANGVALKVVANAVSGAIRPSDK